MSAQQITVKAYYNDLVESQPEIRRFNLDISSNNDVYRSLETTISQLNKDYPQGQFTLQYVDEDNDRITFSSDSELRSALNNVKPGGVLKIYVKPTTKKPESTNDNATVHPGVVCDGCNGPVIGIRYKCAQCPDYDLCQSCSDKNLHPDHNMIKIACPWRGFFGGHRRFGRGPCGGGRWGAGPRFWRHFMQQQQQQQPGVETSFKLPGDMADFLNRYTGKELAELIEAHLPSYLRTEKINEMLNQFKTGEQANKPVDQSILLEHVGKFLQEILSPFGIDCDYFVDNQQTTNATTNEQTATDKNTEEIPTTTNNTSTEPKASATPETASASASASASPNPPSYGNLLDQLQTMLAPMFQPPTATATATATNAAANNQPANNQKKIDECFERMIAMGFVDSNGVLTELIKAKNGDLNQVLDALNPRNYKI